jgi:drug/metabolite transporter (DMT)-like permease
MRWLLVFMIIGANASGDLLNAAGMRRAGEVRDFHPSAIIRLLQKLLHNRFIIGGVIMMAIAFLIQMSLLSIADLSFAVPASAASYIVETLLAKWVLRERISGSRWVGAGLVAAGVLLLQF